MGAILMGGRGDKGAKRGVSPRESVLSCRSGLPITPEDLREKEVKGSSPAQSGGQDDCGSGRAWCRLNGLHMYGAVLLLQTDLLRVSQESFGRKTL